MSGIILHHFDISPFAEKVRLIFGLKGLSWQSVEIPLVMPKPDLTALTGGYGSVFGAAIGAFIMAMSQQGPAFSGWNTDWRYVFLGLILLGSVYANKRVRSIAEAVR